MHVETGANDIRGDEVAAETENDDGDDELQDANGDPTFGIVGHVLLARSSHSGTHLVSIFLNPRCRGRDVCVLVVRGVVPTPDRNSVQYAVGFFAHTISCQAPVRRIIKTKLFYATRDPSAEAVGLLIKSMQIHGNPGRWRRQLVTSLAFFLTNLFLVGPHAGTRPLAESASFL